MTGLRNSGFIIGAEQYITDNFRCHWCSCEWPTRGAFYSIVWREAKTEIVLEYPRPDDDGSLLIVALLECVGCGPGNGYTIELDDLERDGTSGWGALLGEKDWPDGSNRGSYAIDSALDNWLAWRQSPRGQAYSEAGLAANELRRMGEAKGKGGSSSQGLDRAFRSQEGQALYTKYLALRKRAEKTPPVKINNPNPANVEA